jgi:hypothetical protein
MWFPNRLRAIRPESFRVDHDSIRVIERGKALSDENKVLLWRPRVADSLEALQKENKATERSLGIIQPDLGSLKFFWREAKADEQEDARRMQASLFEKPVTAARTTPRQAGIAVLAAAGAKLLLVLQNSSCMYQPIPSHVTQKPVIAIFLVRGRKRLHSNQGTSKRLCKANRT